MEIIAEFGLLSKLYFFSEGAGGASLALLLLFLSAPAVLYGLIRFTAGMMKPAVTREGTALSWKRRAAIVLGLAVPSAEGGAGRYLPHVLLLSARNIAAALALVALTVGAAALWTRPAWIFRAAPREPLTLPFEAAEGNLYLLRIEGPCDANTTLRLGIGGEMPATNLSALDAGNCGGGEAAATVVFRMSRGGRPRIMVEADAGGSYRIVIVRRPVMLMGYFYAELLLFAIAFIAGQAQRRLAPPSPGAPGASALASIAGKGILAASFTASFVAGFCGVWYLGIKALDRAFHFGIWITYDHFIQDFLRRFFL